MEICKQFKKKKTKTLIVIVLIKPFSFISKVTQKLTKKKPILRQKKNIKSNFLEIVLCISKRLPTKYHQAKKKKKVSFKISNKKKFGIFLLTEKGFFEKKKQNTFL